MRKIEIKVVSEESFISISNDNEITVNVDFNNASLKASDVFKLFDNGDDVIYECNNESISTQEGQNLNKNQIMYNDCLELIKDICNSINKKIEDFKSQSNNNDK